MLRAVVAGCGAMSRGWLKACAQLAGEVEIVGLVDLDPARAQALAAEFSLPYVTVGADLGAMLALLQPDLLFDVVVPSARKDVVLTGLAAGCHVLSEKPMATSLEEAGQLIAAARQAGRLHAVVQNRRFLAGVRRLRRLVGSGALGELTGLHCDFFLAPHFGGFREEMAHVLLLDMAIHTFDAARFMAGRAPLAVYCQESNPAGSWYAQGASANAIFELEDGITFTYRGSWCAEGLATSWESQWRLVGTKGSAIWDGEDTFRAETVTGPGDFFSTLEPLEVPALAQGDLVGGHLGVLRDFLGAIREGRQPETDGRDNIRSLAMVLAAIQSAETRQRVAISP